MARSFLAQLQRSLHLTQRGIGGARAVQRGTYAKRVLREELGPVHLPRAAVNKGAAVQALRASAPLPMCRGSLAMRWGVTPPSWGGPAGTGC